MLEVPINGEQREELGVNTLECSVGYSVTLTTRASAARHLLAVARPRVNLISAAIDIVAIDIIK